MLKYLKIQNFKAFGPNTPPIELAPITLIFGQNSAGKSSILQALSLLKQTQEYGFGDTPLLPRVEGGLVDLGSYKEFVFDHDDSCEMKLGLSFTQSKVQARAISMPGAGGMEYGFKISESSGDIVFSNFRILTSDLQESLATLKVKRGTTRDLRGYPPSSRASLQGTRYQIDSERRPFVATCTDISKKEYVWEELYQFWFENREIVIDSMSEKLSLKEREYASRESEGDPRREHMARMLGDLEDKGKDGNAIGSFNDRRMHLRRALEEQRENFKKLQSEAEEEISHIKETIKFYSREFGINEFIERFVAWGLKQRSAVIGFSISGRNVRDSSSLPEVFALEEYGVSKSSGRFASSSNYVDVMRTSSVLSRGVVESLSALFPMGPFRRPPERWYFFTGTSPKDVGYKGDHLPDLLYRKPEVLKRANEWLERLEIGYQLRIKEIGDSGSDLFEVRLIDSRRDKEVEVALSDVGFGISQILPFIVQSLASRDRVISIEQPEVHIHPRLQADLGDLIAESISKPYSHQFLIETHSEHLILRMQKLVREGKLRPEDLSVLFVSRGKLGSEVNRIRLDKDGDFIDEWPGGFFSERRRELRF
ncbi:AAA family ATPase [Halioglobus sp. Uisw_031]|uniref:AAA family ATPase n=1 Tax=Halioglobus sp. Uisw_031 TaxID=3230977 RepID=UPI0039EB7A2F